MASLNVVVNVSPKVAHSCYMYFFPANCKSIWSSTSVISINLSKLCLLNILIYLCNVSFYICRELLEELHFLLREALDRRAEVIVSSSRSP